MGKTTNSLQLSGLPYGAPSGTYNQDVWEEFKTHQQIWDDYIQFGNTTELDGLIAETQELASMPKETLVLYMPYLKSDGVLIDEDTVIPFLIWVVQYVQAHQAEVGIGLSQVLEHVDQQKKGKRN